MTLEEQGQAGSLEEGAKGAASDEELARRLHEQLNGEGLGVVRRRTRKQPVFYTPQVQVD